jgi:hypothetical protein
VYLFAPAVQVKPIELSPFELLHRILFIGLVIYVGIILIIFFLKRGLAWLDDRFWITYSGQVPTYGTLGNAFLVLQSLAQPEKQYVIEMKEDEKQKKEQDDIGSSGDPTPEAEQDSSQNGPHPSAILKAARFRWLGVQGPFFSQF